MSTTDEGRQAVLQELRKELDAIDETLLNAILLRHRCTRRVGELKESNAIPVMQPNRVRVVLERATSFAETHDMNPQALQDVFTTLIIDACREEERGSAHHETSTDRIESLVEKVRNHAHISH